MSLKDICKIIGKCQCIHDHFHVKHEIKSIVHLVYKFCPNCREIVACPIFECKCDKLTATIRKCAQNMLNQNLTNKIISFKRGKNYPENDDIIKCVDIDDIIDGKNIYGILEGANTMIFDKDVDIKKDIYRNLLHNLEYMDRYFQRLDGLIQDDKVFTIKTCNGLI
ncbi:hypothetical protein A3Q56_02976 [Intoshia linei]|uniref:Uncharacterized protein n=1 Tax=Intoshia linei TaxID=1819745 RepID=A0A177B6M1_9BILA|nr:hypothetical protein A3Q56_02976 [Intoshia linei]